MQKNVGSQTLDVFAWDTVNATGKTGDAANITGKVSIDDGTLTAIGDTNPTEVESGYYRFTLTQAETNGNKLTFVCVSATANIEVFPLPAGTIYTIPATIGIEKNAALTGFTFCMVSSTDHITAATGLTVTATRSIDGAAFAACANSVAEISSGWYSINLAAADLNGNTIALLFTATGADPVRLFIKTES